MFLNFLDEFVKGVPYRETKIRLADGNGRYRWCRVRATAQFDPVSYTHLDVYKGQDFIILILNSISGRLGWRGVTKTEKGVVLNLSLIHI